MAGPLTTLTAKGIDINSRLVLKKSKQAFEGLIAKFSSAPFLIHFDFNLQRYIHVDSSGYAYSGILSQKDKDGNLRPVAYFSRKLTPAERRWQVHDQELGAIVACFEEWQAWLLGSNEPITVYSDHANLRYFMRAQELTARQARWAAFLSEFLFEIVHIPGKLNPADPASRRIDYSGEKEITDKVILLGHCETIQINAISLRQLKIRRICDPSSTFMPADENTMKAIRALYITDDFLANRLPTALTFKDGIWWWRDRIYVPKAMRNMILKNVHDSPTGGHWGIMRTLDLLYRTFVWQNARADVLIYIKQCRSCQSIKVNHRPPQGKMTSLAIPDRPWSVIGVDFIVKLPISKGFDSVMVVVDHFSKTAHFIEAKESWNADKLAEAFISQVFQLHGLPDTIVSDRGTTFMSQFWTSVLRQLCINPAPSTAFHPQTDGQVERIDDVLEDYLRHYVSMEQDDWTTWLPMAEFAYNNTPSASTRFSPFFAIHGYHPRFNSLVASSGIPLADKFVSHLQDIQHQLIDNLSRAKASQARFYDKNRRIDVCYMPGDLVWLSRRYIKTQRPNSKLDVRRIGPFKIKRMIGKNAAELILPANLSRLHPVFNVSLLMPYVTNDVSGSLQVPMETRDFVQDFVTWASSSYVLDYRCTLGNIHEYLMRDDDPSGLNDEWRLLTTISPNLDMFLQEFHQRTPSRGSGPPTSIWNQRKALQV